MRAFAQHGPLNPGGEIDARAMARTLGVVYLAGATLAVLWVVLPSPQASDQSAVGACAVAGEAVGLALVSGLCDRLPRFGFEVAVAIATALISLAVYLARVRGSGLEFLYMWCTPYAYWFFPRRRALAQAGFVIVGFAVAEALASRHSSGLDGAVSTVWSRVLLLAGTVFIVGELVRHLGESLGASHLQFARVFAEAPTPMARLDLDGRCVAANAAFCEALGREHADVVGAQVEDLVGRDRLRELLPARERLLAGDPRGSQLTLRFRRPDGVPATLFIHVSLLGRVGEPHREMFVQALDLTERDQAEQARAVTEARLRSIIDNAPAAITVRDADGRLTVVNRAAARLMGAEPGALLGRRYEAVYPPETVALMREQERQVLDRGEPIFDEEPLRSADGEHYFLAATFPFPAAAGHMPELCRIAFDVSDRERARQALLRSHDARRRLLAELVRAQEAERRRIAADVHDDSIQVLAGVAIRLGMLAGMLERPEQQQLIAGLDESVRQGIKSLRQLLFDLRLPALDELGLAAALGSYLSETIAPEGVRFTLEDRLDVEPAPELRTVLYRVAQEALANVRKHARAGEVEVVLASRDGAVTVTVRDDGVGFEATDHAAEVPGHLGMVGMRERVEAAGGWLEIDSRPGAGTTVHFGVPAEVPASVAGSAVGEG
jgi:PAS domain S-box-containing protein